MTDTAPKLDLFLIKFLQVNYLSALSGGVQFGFLVIVLPFLSKVLISRCHLSAHIKDQFIAIGSLVALTTGSVLVGLGPQIWMVIIGNGF